jgi:hypothetical protein
MRTAVPVAQLGSYVLVLPPKTADVAAMAREWRAFLAAGSSELHVYHLGLASTRRLNAAADALSSTRR